MKKAFVLLLALICAGALFAEEAAAPAVNGYTVSGSVEFGVKGNTDDPLWNVSGSGSGSVSGVANLSIDNEKMAAAVSVNLVPTISMTDGDGESSTGQNSCYTLLDAARSFYIWATAHVSGFNGTVTEIAGIITDKFEKTGAASGALADYDILDIDAINDDGGLTEADYNNMRQDFSDLQDAIYDIIDSMGALTDAEVASLTQDAFIDQYGYVWKDDSGAFGDRVNATAYTGTVKDAVAKQVSLAISYREDVLGAITDDTYSASYAVKSASLKLKKLFGVADLTAYVNGTTIGVGDMVASTSAKQDSAPLGVGIDLASDVVPGVSAGLLFNVADATAAVSEDWETIASEADDAGEHTYGFAVYGGYANAGDDMSFGAKLYLGALYLDSDDTFADNMVLGFTGNFGMKSLANLAADVEFDYLGGGGMGIGAKVGASVMGIAPSVKFLMKNESYGGDGDYTTHAIDDDYYDASTDSTTTDAGFASEFNSTDSTALTALQIGLSLNTKDLMDLELATVSGGYDMFLAGSENNGWNASVDFALNGLIGQPLTVGFSAYDWSGYGDDVDPSYTISLGYTYDALAVSAQYSVDQYNGDHTYSVLGKVSF